MTGASRGIGAATALALAAFGVLFVVLRRVAKTRGSVWLGAFAEYVAAGAALALTAAIGVVRFPDTLSRMHAASKPQVLGLLLVLAGAAMSMTGSAAAAVSVVSFLGG